MKLYAPLLFGCCVAWQWSLTNALPAICADTRRRLSSQADMLVALVGDDDEDNKRIERCGKFSLALRVDTHLYMVASPLAAHANCSSVVFHSTVDGKTAEDELSYYELNYGSAGELSSIASPYDMIRGGGGADQLPLGDFSMLDLAQAFHQADDTAAKMFNYDVVRNNCASFVSNMMNQLGIVADQRMANFIAKRLHENQVTIMALRASPHVATILPSGEESHEELPDDVLLNYLTNHYIQTHEDRRARLLNGESLCSLCSDGTFDYTEDPNKVIYTKYIPCKDQTRCVSCADLENVVRNLNQMDVDAGLCKGYQELAGIYCGCSARPTGISCPLCADGSVPATLEAPVLTSEFYFESCREAIKLGSTTPAGGAGCEQLQRIGYTNCGCPIPASVVDPCQLCGDDALPDPSLEVFPGTTCQGVEQLASTEEDGSPTCSAYQNIAGHYCNCPNADLTASSCQLCGTNTPLPDPSRTVRLGDGSIETCLFLEIQANVQNTCAATQTLASSVCCAAEPQCTLCSDGQVPTVDLDAPLDITLSDIDIVRGAFRYSNETLTCNSLQQFMSVISANEGYCNLVRQVSEAKCGCVYDQCNSATVVTLPAVGEPPKIEAGWSETATLSYSPTGDDCFSDTVGTQGVWYALQASDSTGYVELTIEVKEVPSFDALPIHVFNQCNGAFAADRLMDQGSCSFTGGRFIMGLVPDATIYVFVELPGTSRIYFELSTSVAALTQQGPGKPTRFTKLDFAPRGLARDGTMALSVMSVISGETLAVAQKTLLNKVEFTESSSGMVLSSVPYLLKNNNNYDAQLSDFMDSDGDQVFFSSFLAKTLLDITFEIATFNKSDFVLESNFMVPLPPELARPFAFNTVRKTFVVLDQVNEVFVELSQEGAEQGQVATPWTPKLITGMAHDPWGSCYWVLDEGIVYQVAESLDTVLQTLPYAEFLGDFGSDITVMEGGTNIAISYQYPKLIVEYNVIDFCRPLPSSPCGNPGHVQMKHDFFGLFCVNLCMPEFLVGHAQTFGWACSVCEGK